MQTPNRFIRTESALSVLSVNKVLRNTYLLLGLSLIFSSLTAGLALVTQAPPMNPFMTLIIYMGLLFSTSYFRNSTAGIFCVFALTGFLGYTLGPLLNVIMHEYANGAQLIMTALGTTGLIFFALSAYVLTTRKNFSYMGGMLMVACLAAFILGMASIIFTLPLLNVFVSAIFVLVSSGLILYQTSEIVHGGETNYILATVSIYVSLFNLFVSLLNILSFFNNRE